MVRVGLVQLTASDDPAANLTETTDFIGQAVAGGATFVLTPEVTNCVSTSRSHQSEILRKQENDASLAALQAQAHDLGVWVLIGSLALATDEPDGRFANRSFLIDPSGKIVATYDKIHMFDVNVSETETYRESASFRPGNTAIVAETAFARIGMSVCYDLRFPHLYRNLAQAGAQIITVPAAFSPVTGAAHWETLLRARAIETGCFILAPAQTGEHRQMQGKSRKTWGHSLVVSPWGKVLADAGRIKGVTLVDIDLSDVSSARQRIPSLCHDRPYEGP